MARMVLSSAESLDAKRVCLMPELEYQDEDLTKLLDSLKTTKMWKMAAVQGDGIDSILNPDHGDNKPPESDALLIWDSILKDRGEQASLAIRVSKSNFAYALNTGCSARKCDCTLSIGKMQFGNGEDKRASSPPGAVKVQLRKYIKIARLVMLGLSLQANVFRVVPWRGVYVAAPACDPIVLPTTEAAWNLFIENTAHHLKNLQE
ncbi:hypothetical protein BGX30_008974 [Mortierella sp. GBA39]|nr:hypothetical protein BGX30_008974 [Mortierella sp. GBA39]